MRNREKGTCCLTEGLVPFRDPMLSGSRTNRGQHTGVLEEVGRIGFKLPSVMGEQGASNVTSTEEKQPRAR